MLHDIDGAFEKNSWIGCYDQGKDTDYQNDDV